MAAHLEGKGVSVLDMTGMSQKNGSVTSHVRFARKPTELRAQRIATGEADLILGCDLLTAGAADAISKISLGRTLALINTHEQPPGQFARNPDWQFPAAQVRSLIAESAGSQTEFLDATRIATALMGDSIAANLFMLGFAFQRGAIPLSLEALMKAIELNGVAVTANQEALQWGRLCAVDQPLVERMTTTEQRVMVQMPESLGASVKRHVAFLTAYQHPAYAATYKDFVEVVSAAEKRAGRGDAISRAVANNLFKLMAYKDEYEVARLYTDGSFRQQLEAQFEGNFKLSFNLAPPMFSKKDRDGHLIKRRYGSWMLPVFKLLAALKVLRGTALDVFGATEERRMERSLITQYREVVSGALAYLQFGDAAAQKVLELARLPESIRGYGHVKMAHVLKARQQQAVLLSILKDASEGCSSAPSEHGGYANSAVSGSVVTVAVV
jgi:indolepyruvate ferredoxin oxidoreductase